MHVLIVDDDEASRYLLTSILASAGHAIDAAVDGVEALARARSTRPDVVISDILMPRMDGYQLLREWKADPLLSAVPVIFYTASYTDPADEKFALDLGADGFLNKPVEPALLLQTIADVTAYDECLSPRVPRIEDEALVLREYSERLVHKLEEKVVDLERSNAMLESALAALNEDMEIKKQLLQDLRLEVDERRRREEELRQERDFSSRLVDTADIFIVGLDRNLCISLFSPGAARRSGYPPEDVMGKSFVDLFVPDEERALASRYVRSIQSGEVPLGRVGPIRIASGETRVYEWTATPSADTEESAAGVLLFGIDVTENVNAAAVDRAMARIDLAVLLDRPRSEILDIACERLVSEFGMALAFVVLRDKEAGDLLELQSVAGSLAASLDTIDTTTSFLEVCPVREAIEHDVIFILDAEEVASYPGALELEKAQLAAFPLRAHGVTMGAIGMVSTGPRPFETRRKESLRRLVDRVAIGLLVVEAREQVALQSAALESAGNAVVIATASGRVSWVNRAFCELTGHPVFEAIGVNLFNEGEGYSELSYAQGWGVVLQGKLYRDELQNRRKDGSLYHEEVTLTGVLDDNGDIGHVVIIKHDISERRELEQLKSDFVDMVSHELRTPLTSIIGYADLITQGLDGSSVPKTVTSAVTRLQGNASRMHSLVEQLLEVLQFRADLFSLVLKDVDIGRVVSTAADSLAHSPQHDVIVDIEPDLEPVSCDPHRLGTVIEVLLDNAIKYSPDGGPVCVDVRSLPDAVTISVSDQGVGMPAAQIPGLFDPFTQLDMSSTRRFGGMGLGLFLAYNIVRAHGGVIIAASEESSGSTFTVRLPVRVVRTDSC